jgi:hypothetical protein
MADLEGLSQEEKIKVFWLQKHLYQSGIEGIEFSGRMTNYIREEGEEKMQKDIESDLSGSNF